MTQQDPPRLFEHARDPALRDALRAATHEAPSHAQLELLAERVSGALAPAAASSVLTAAWVKLTLGALALAGALYAAHARVLEPVPVPEKAPVMDSTPARASATATSTHASRDEPAQAWVEPTSEALPRVSSPHVAQPTRDLSSSRRKARSERHASAHTPSAAAHDTVAEPEPAAQPVPPEVPGELALLQRAQHALRDAPRRALALAARHRALYPDGEFAEERDVTTLDALARLRDASLPARVRDFLRRYPNSFHGKRVRRLLAE